MATLGLGGAVAIVAGVWTQFGPGFGLIALGGVALGLAVLIHQGT